MGENNFPEIYKTQRWSLDNYSKVKKMTALFNMDTSFILSECKGKELAELLHFELTTHNKKEIELHFEGNQIKFVSYSDGYFGRPKIPSYVYLFRRLRKQEREELQDYFKKLNKKTGLIVRLVP